MISIAEAISDLLFVRDTVVVPGLGAFVRKPCPAKVDTETNRFTMPSCQISFDAGLREDNDLIIKYLVKEIGIPENEAKRMLFHFVSDCFNSLKAGQKVHLKDIGTLSFGPGNEMVFEQDPLANYNADAFGLCDFAVDPVSPVVEEEVPVAADTPSSVDETSQQEEEVEEREIGKGVWPFMFGLILLMSVILYFQVFRPAFFGEKEQMTEATDEANDERTIDPQVIEELVGDMIGQIVKEEMALSKETTIPPMQVRTDDTIRIIAGCYDREETAQWRVNSLQNKGYVNAFKEKRGERWFVAYDRYHTEEEAHAALREIREVRGDKGWILK